MKNQKTKFLGLLTILGFIGLLYCIFSYPTLQTIQDKATMYDQRDSGFVAPIYIAGQVTPISNFVLFNIIIYVFILFIGVYLIGRKDKT
jgi:hypothetical protein